MSTGEKPSTRTLACEELAFAIAAGGSRIQAKSVLPPGTSLTGGGTVLVFLHEGLGSITQWRHFPSALAQATGLPALVYDRCGHGRSAARSGPLGANYLEVEAFERLPEVLAACGIEAPLLVGHSDGGTIALLYAARYPENLVGAVVEAPHPFIEDQTLVGIWRTLHAFDTTSLRERLRAHHGEQVEAMFRSWSEAWLSPAFREWSMVPLLRDIRCPVLAIQGEDDEYGTPEQIRAILEGVSGPAEAMLVPACAHSPHLQARDQVLERIARFIGRIAASRGSRAGRM
jgi:pimeloyl-ACP methyl ester carboxylesterase